MKIVILKSRRLLTLLSESNEILFSAPIALGASPTGAKTKAGDQKTPEGNYFVCLKKIGKYGPSLGVSYPNAVDAKRQGASPELVQCIARRAKQGLRPPWGTEAGGEIFIHGGGTQTDWTAGCIALSDQDAETLYSLVEMGTEIHIEA